MRVVCSILVCLVIAGRAEADDPAGAEADRLFEEGRALAKEKKYVEACDRFERSFKLDPTLGTQLNLADCHEQLGHLRLAWQLFDDAAAKAAGDHNRATFARDRAAALGARLATIVIHPPQPVPAGMTVSIAERPVASDGGLLRDRVEPGDVEIVATIPGRPPFTRRVKAVAGATADVTIPDPSPPADRGRTHRTPRLRLAWALADTGLAVGAAGVLLTLRGRGAYNDAADGSHCTRVGGGIVCDDTGDKQIASAQRLADLGTACAIGTTALIVAAATIYLTAPREHTRVAPVITPSSVGLLVDRAF